MVMMNTETDEDTTYSAMFTIMNLMKYIQKVFNSYLFKNDTRWKTSYRKQPKI